jgi:rfaE bifunctional protein kinase chain/domain
MFEKFKNVGNQNILVIGDIILDKYIYGQTTRISPEAPVPIVLSEEERYVLGGAANVAANLNSLGAKTFLIGCIGDDQNGKIVLDLVDNTLLDSAGILKSSKKTTTKSRIVSKGQQLLRIDDENTSDLSSSEEILILSLIKKAILSNSFNGIILQDYNKGIFTDKLIQEILQLAKDNSLPVFVDPKHKNFWKYQGATIFKPNLSEILSANDIENYNSLDDLLIATFKRLKCELLMCTLADEGIAFVQDGIVSKSPTQKIDVVDVSGAGDSALSIIVMGFLLGYDAKSIALLANLCGKIACMKSGVSIISFEELISAYDSVYKDIAK